MMKKALIFAFMFLFLAGLFFSQPVSASVCSKNQLTTKFVNQNCPEVGADNYKNGKSKQLNTVSVSNLFESAFNLELRTWVVSQAFANKIKPTTGCFKIYKRNGQIIEASNFKLLDKSIEYKLCQSSDEPTSVVLLSEVAYVTDDDGNLVYGGHSEYFSLIAFLCLCLGLGSIFFLGPLGVAIGIVPATIFGLLSISRLVRRGKEYTNRRIAWVLAIFSTLVSLALICIFAFVIFSI